MRVRFAVIASALVTAWLTAAWLVTGCSGSGGGAGDWPAAGGSSSSSGGASSGSTAATGSSGSGSGAGGSSSGGGAVDGGSLGGPAGPDASATARDGAVEDGAGGARADAPGSGASPDATTVGDGGMQPFKGVANSACADLANLGVTWWYNWTGSPGSCATPPFVPMVWGHANEQSFAAITTAISNMASAGYRAVLGFNEPDNTSQSNLSVATAISLWPAMKSPSIRIGSPATQGNSTGLTWIQTFMSQVNADTSGTLKVDFIATHWYGWNAGSCDASGTNLEAWIKQIEAIPGNRPIWLTEWGCLNQSNPSTAVVQAFYSGAIAMFAKHPRLERYAWYPWTTNNGLVTSGALTSLGTVFAAAPAYR